ncbi:MAG: Uma2 family endonuclease [bacterium]
MTQPLSPDILDHLDHAPRAEPVRLKKAGRPWTIADLMALADDENHYELVRGELMMMSPASPRHGRYASRLVSALGTHVEQDDLGEVYTAEPGFVLHQEPEPVVRAPDIAFVRKDRIPPEEKQAGFWELAPDLVAEIISPSETAQDVQEKVRDYLTAGTQLIWLVYPGTRTVVEYRSRTRIRELTFDDSLDGQEVIPGFRYPLGRLFR